MNIAEAIQLLGEEVYGQLLDEGYEILSRSCLPENVKELKAIFFVMRFSKTLEYGLDTIELMAYEFFGNFPSFPENERKIWDLRIGSDSDDQSDSITVTVSFYAPKQVVTSVEDPLAETDPLQ